MAGNHSPAGPPVDHRASDQVDDAEPFGCLTRQSPLAASPPRHPPDRGCQKGVTGHRDGRGHSQRTDHHCPQAERRRFVIILCARHERGLLTVVIKHPDGSLSAQGASPSRPCYRGDKRSPGAGGAGAATVVLWASLRIASTWVKVGAVVGQTMGKIREGVAERAQVHVLMGGADRNDDCCPDDFGIPSAH